jgi:hypothetical protein
MSIAIAFDVFRDPLCRADRSLAKRYGRRWSASRICGSRVLGLTRRELRGLAAFFTIVIFSTAALAEGQGRYSVNGTSAKDNSNYQGMATLTKTGNMIWQMVEVVGDSTREGFGIGDGRVITISFGAADGSTALALYIVNSDGSYTGTWARDGDKEVSTETLKPQ